jgi:hypothetical protein
MCADLALVEQALAEREWPSCGHTSASVCFQCYVERGQALATLEAERDALRAVVADMLAMVTEGRLLRNTTNDGHMPSYLAESARLVNVLSRAHSLLSTSEPRSGDGAQ